MQLQGQQSQLEACRKNMDSCGDECGADAGRVIAPQLRSLLIQRSESNFLNTLLLLSVGCRIKLVVVRQLCVHVHRLWVSFVFSDTCLLFWFHFGGLWILLVAIFIAQIQLLIRGYLKYSLNGGSLGNKRQKLNKYDLRGHLGTNKVCLNQLTPLIRHCF